MENDSRVKKKAAFGTSERRPWQMRLSILEGEINAAAHHAEVIVRTVDKVPAEIIDPADVRSETDFEATANLADCLCLRTCMTYCHGTVEKAVGLFKT